MQSSAFNELLGLVQQGLDSNFGTALAGAAGGAIAGAWAAQAIARRSDRRKDQISEIRSVNAATNLVIGIVNSYIGMKRPSYSPVAK
jgi:hypothetical protein